MATYQQTPTSLIVQCSDEADRAVMIAALVDAGWHSADLQFPDLKLDPTGKSKPLARALAAIIRAGAVPVATATRREWEHRVVVQEWNKARSEPVLVVDDRRMVLTGHGATFTGREIDGPLWGDQVCYAYYVGENA